MKSLGRILYEAFISEFGALPRWNDLTKCSQEAYERAAKAVEAACGCSYD